MIIAELQPCIILKDFDPISDNSFPIFIKMETWSCYTMIRNDETDRTSLTPHKKIEQHSGRFHICVKMALSSTLKQISNSRGHVGFNDETPNKEQL